MLVALCLMVFFYTGRGETAAKIGVFADLAVCLLLLSLFICDEWCDVSISNAPYHYRLFCCYPLDCTTMVMISVFMSWQSLILLIFFIFWALLMFSSLLLLLFYLVLSVLVRLCSREYYYWLFNLCSSIRLSSSAMRKHHPHYGSRGPKRQRIRRIPQREQRSSACGGPAPNRVLLWGASL